MTLDPFLFWGAWTSRAPGCGDAKPGLALSIHQTLASLLSVLHTIFSTVFSMGREMKLNQRDFFKQKLGISLKNPYWSWGAVDTASNRVFLRLWKNQIEQTGTTEEVVVLGHDWNDRINGYAERLKHIEIIEEGAEGIGILCEPKISKDGSWHIDDYDDKMLVRLSGIVRRNGAIYARILGRISIQDLKGAGATFGPILPQKITRIAYNSKGWQRPSGDAKKQEATGTYNNQHGFGHEEWLFRSDWLIDGWRYAFIQGINKSQRKLVAAKEAFDLTLFAIQPDGRRRYVAVIKEVECLDEQSAESAIKIFKETGWFKQMLEEIREVGGDADALGNSPEAKHVLNVRFRLENVVHNRPDDFANENDPIIRLNRYLIYDLAQDENLLNSALLRRRKGSPLAPSSNKVVRRGTGASEYTPEHALMQKKLLLELKKEFPGAEIIAEQDFIDVTVRMKAELLLFEIKSDLEPRAVIRQALGQILEYAFHPQRAQKLPVRLVIVGRRKLSVDEQSYLDRLRNEFTLPLEYRVVSIYPT